MHAQSYLLPPTSYLPPPFDFARPPKHPVDVLRPYAFLAEAEATAAGRVEQIATVFLTNRECPFHCVYCDLWRNTTDERVPVGAIPAQIDYALQRLPPARHIKLYNSGNFLDPQAIPPEDHEAIARRVRGFSTVIVENHPRLCGESCPRFAEMVETELEVALGLETVDAPTLARLNKQMTVADFDRAVEYLLRHNIAVRAFILLRPPGQSEEQGLYWALRSIEHARSRGVRCCTVIPVRGGNGVMEQLAAAGQFSPPRLSSLEQALEQGLSIASASNHTNGRRFRVFVDLWDLARFSNCPHCLSRRTSRLHAMNISQTVLPPVECPCGVA
ncbi:MAG: radical SAM protein [Pirellulales bacterium]